MRPSLLLLGMALAVSGCASVLRSTATCPCVTPPASWSTVLRDAEGLAAEGRFAAADSALLEFERASTSNHFSREVVFWRALYQLDPRNPVSDRNEAVRLLDDYLQSDSVYWYRAEARVLRQLAAMPTQAVVSAPPTQTGLPAPTTIPIARAADATLTEKDVEIQALRDRVARLNEELERIKRRLSAP